jgi:hypothetical protein
MANTGNSHDIQIFGIKVRTGCKSPWMRLLFLVVILSFLTAVIFMLQQYVFAAVAALKLPNLPDFIKRLKGGVP